MAHFAELDENNIVKQVIVVSNDDCGGGNFPESEIPGQQFINSLGFNGIWKQTSYNSNFRKHYAGIGHFYDEQRDAFIPPKPYESWILNEDTCLWDSPIPMPETDGFWIWNEDLQQWEEINA